MSSILYQGIIGSIIFLLVCMISTDNIDHTSSYKVQKNTIHFDQDVFSLIIEDRVKSIAKSGP